MMQITKLMKWKKSQPKKLPGWSKLPNAGYIAKIFDIISTIDESWVVGYRPAMFLDDVTTVFAKKELYDSLSTETLVSRYSFYNGFSVMALVTQQNDYLLSMQLRMTKEARIINQYMNYAKEALYLLIMDDTSKNIIGCDSGKLKMLHNLGVYQATLLHNFILLSEKYYKVDSKS